MLRNRITALLFATGLGLSALAWAPSAGGSPVTAAEFTAALRSAIEESGVFSPGTTLTDSYTTMTAKGAPDRIEVSVVNPDGSFITRAGYLPNVTEVRCLRFDRCWQRHPDAFPARRWRVIPASEEARYESAPSDRAMLFAPRPDAEGTFDITSSPEAGMVFTWTRTYGAADDGSPPETSVDTWAVKGSTLTTSTWMTMRGVLGLYSTRQWTGSPTTIPVTAPKGKGLPELQGVYLSVPINGCADLPAQAECG